MHFLLSNDDGYQSQGLACLFEMVSQLGSVDVVAPDRDRSGASHSLTLDRPLRVKQDTKDFYYVNGTPTDCVHLAITGMLDREPDMVISGINNGANMGDDVMYSGTVAAAMEARYLGCPAIAVSMAGQEPFHFDTAARVLKKLISEIISSPLDENLLLNINIPNLPYEQIKGIEITRLGYRHKSEQSIAAVDPRGKPIYWIGPVGEIADAGIGTDFYAIENKCVSVTPLHADLTHHEKLQSFAKHPLLQL